MTDIPWQVGVIFAVLFGVLFVKLAGVLLDGDSARKRGSLAGRIGRAGTSFFTTHR